VTSAILPASHIEARDIVVIRDGRRVLDRASIRVKGGQIATIEGPSGCGKSTFLRALATLIEPDAGDLLLDGVLSAAIGPRAYRTRVAYVPQQPPMFEGTVGTNVAMGPYLRGESVDQDAIATLLGRVGLEGFRLRVARDLSGGEQQRVALARALANSPHVLLLDEPTAALDPDSASHVLELVRGLAAAGLAVVVVTHTAPHAAALGAFRYRIESGRVHDSSGGP
jgi:putative ABC transport system ATP-binding protein